MFQVVHFGMSGAVGEVSFDLSQWGNLIREKPFSEATAQLIDEEVRSLIDAAFHRTLELITDKKEVVEKVWTFFHFVVVSVSQMGKEKQRTGEDDTAIFKLHFID